MNDYTISDEEWNQRRLCSDDSCIGVIGPDGRCKECGKPCEAPVIKTAASTATGAGGTSEPAPQEAPQAQTPETASPDETNASVADDDWANRRLCPDGNCIGVIGPDGRCKECGRSAE